MRCDLARIRIYVKRKLFSSVVKLFTCKIRKIIQRKIFSRLYLWEKGCVKQDSRKESECPVYILESVYIFFSYLESPKCYNIVEQLS